MQKGLFITFEGPEGSGKSTHITLLARFLQQKGYRVLLTKEPGGTMLAQDLRRILLNTTLNLAPIAELMLYEADRAQHVEECVLPALRRGKIVLCDRYTDSTVAYQGYGRQLDLAMINGLNRVASGGLKPDLTVLLDVDVQRGLRQARKAKKGHDRLERAGLAFHRRVRQGFLRLAAKEPQRFRVVQQQKDVSQTQRLIRECVQKFFLARSLVRHSGNL